MSLRDVLGCVRNNSRVRLEVTKVVHAVNNLQVQRLRSLKPVEQWRWAHERPVWELNCAAIAANPATAAFAFDSGGWTVASIVPMPTGSRRLPRNCFRILGPNVSRMIAIGSLINHGTGGGPFEGVHRQPVRQMATCLSQVPIAGPIIAR